MVEVSATSVADGPQVPERWVLSQEPSGVWSALVNLDGDWIPLGYFGAREDAEETIAACFQPTRPLEARAG